MGTRDLTLAQLIERLKEEKSPGRVAAYMRIYARHAAMSRDKSVVLRHDAEELDQIADWLDELAASRKS